MGQLNEQAIRRYLLANRKVYQYLCDTCREVLIPLGHPVHVLKWAKRDKSLPDFLGKSPLRVECDQCFDRKHPRKEEKTISSAVVNVAALNEAGLNQVAQKVILSLCRSGELKRDEMKSKLFRKKVIREMKKSEVLKTLVGLRKLKVIRVKKGVWVISNGKKKKREKAHA